MTLRGLGAPGWFTFVRTGSVAEAQCFTRKSRVQDASGFDVTLCHAVSCSHSGHVELLCGATMVQKVKAMSKLLNPKPSTQVRRQSLSTTMPQRLDPKLTSVQVQEEEEPQTDENPNQVTQEASRLGEFRRLGVRRA